MEVTITGDWEEKSILINDNSLSPESSLRLIKYNDAGHFQWGYSGTAVLQLALAILLEYTDEVTAIDLHMRFMKDHLEPLHESDFILDIDINRWIKENDN